MNAPVEVTRSNPLTFSLDGGNTVTFNGYRLDEDPHTLKVTRRRGCVDYTVGVFTHHSTVDQLYRAVVEDTRKM